VFRHRRQAMWTRRTFFASAAVVVLCAGWAAAQVIDLDAPKEKAKPEIWQKASAADVKRAEEAARKDGCLRLVEAVYRLPVSGERDILDMMLRNKQVDKDLIDGLSKCVPVGADYLEDGTVRVTVVTTPAQVVTVLKAAYAKVDWDLAEEDSVIAAVGTQTKADTQILAVGEAALTGSVGEKRIPVRRAAMAKAGHEIGVEVAKLVLREDDWRETERKWLRDFALAFKQVPAKIALGLGTMRVHSEKWADDGSVELRAEVDAIVVAQLINRAYSLYDRRRKFSDWGFGTLLNATRDMIFHAEVKASPKDRPPSSAPLAMELEAVDSALKVPIKDK